MTSKILSQSLLKHAMKKKLIKTSSEKITFKTRQNLSFEKEFYLHENKNHLNHYTFLRNCSPTPSLSQQ